MNINENIELAERPEKHCGIPGANLTYLAPPGQFFMASKSFIGTQKLQIVFVIKDKFVCTMKMYAFLGNVILEHGGVHTKLVISPLLLILDH